MRQSTSVNALVSVILLLGTVLVGLIARTAPVTRQDLHVDLLARQLRFPIATDVFLALTDAASEIVGVALLLIGVVALVTRGRR